MCRVLFTKASSLSAAALNVLLVRLDIQKDLATEKLHLMDKKRLLTHNIYVRTFSKLDIMDRSFASKGLS